MLETAVTKVQELVYELRAGEVMTEGVISVSPSTEMKDLREVLRGNRIAGAPVIDHGKIVGIISIEDFIHWLVDGSPNCTIEERMSANPCVIHSDDPLVQAVNMLERFGFGRLPVLDRRSGHLAGIITKGDILRGLLKKLEVDYLQVERQTPRAKHVFEDIIADKSVLSLEYQIAAEDFSRAGACAGSLKKSLRHIGVSPVTTRRAAIAAYEAEMNVIFYAGSGRMIAEVDPRAIHLDVVDNGPGIPDIEAAMRPGFSTAPEWVRELGFGAGMGLSNIQKCADRLDLTSNTGKGTRLEIEILLESARDAEQHRRKTQS